MATVLGLRGWPVSAEEAAAVLARDLAVFTDVLRDEPRARLHLTQHLDRGCTGTYPGREGGRGAGHLRRDSASPGTHGRVARGSAPLCLGCTGWGRGNAATRWPDAATLALPYATRLRAPPRGSCSPHRRGDLLLAALMHGTADAVATDHAPHNVSSTRCSSSASPPTESAASKRRWGSCLLAAATGPYCRSPSCSRGQCPAPRRCSAPGWVPARSACRLRRRRPGRPRRLPIASDTWPWEATPWRRAAKTRRSIGSASGPAASSDHAGRRCLAYSSPSLTDSDSLRLREVGLLSFTNIRATRARSAESSAQEGDDVAFWRATTVRIRRAINLGDPADEVRVEPLRPGHRGFGA